MQEMIHIMGVYNKFFIAEGLKMITSSVKFFLLYLYIIFQNDSILRIEASNNCKFFFQNMIRIIHTFMEDYRCQLADFVNIRHLTDKSMLVNGNERNHPRNFCGSNLIWCLIEELSHNTLLKIIPHPMIHFIFANELWY